MPLPATGVVHGVGATDDDDDVGDDGIAIHSTNVHEFIHSSKLHVSQTVKHTCFISEL